VQQFAGAGHGHQLALRQVYGQSLDVGSVPHDFANPLRKLAEVHLGAGAKQAQGLVLRYLMLHNRDVEHLLALIHIGQLLGQRRPTDVTLRGQTHHDNYIRGLHSLKRFAFVAFLPSRLVPARLPLRGRLLQTIRGRRLAGVFAVLAQLPPQLPNPRCKRLDCRKQLTDQSVLLSRCPVGPDPVAARCLVDLHAFFSRHQNFWCQNFC
jgi:hypothetical protein